MPRFVRGPVIGHYVQPDLPAAPTAPAGPPVAPALVDQLVTVATMYPAAVQGDPVGAGLVLGTLDPTSPAPLVAVHVAVSTTPLPDSADGPTILATAGLLFGQWTQTTPPVEPGATIRVDVAGVPAGSGFWYTVLEYAA